MFQIRINTHGRVVWQNLTTQARNSAANLIWPWTLRKVPKAPRIDAPLCNTLLLYNIGPNKSFLKG